MGMPFPQNKGGRPKSKRMTREKCEKYAKLVKEGKDWGAAYSSLRESFVAITESLSVHARAGTLPPEELAATAERVEKILKSLKDSGMIEDTNERIDGFDIPGLFKTEGADEVQVRRDCDA